ncbi:hypothetical protein Bbelb_241770 [Branchiostoma belcheri]|nr:hypothetical protein Bbelb_241770 [Branchiostoma belcheri]
MYEQAEPVRTPPAGSGREQNNRPRAPYPDPPGRRGNTGGHVGCNVEMYEQAEPVRTPQAGSGREHNVGPRAPYHFPPGSRGNTGGHAGCNVEMYEQAEPVRTPPAGSGREQNNRPRAPYPDPPGRRGNTSGHVNRDKHASHKFKQQDTSLTLYEEAESVKLENISGDTAYETDKSTDTDRTQRNEAKGRCSCTCYMASGLAVMSTLLIVGIILLMSINDEINNHEKDIPDITTTLDNMNLGRKQNQTDTMEQRLNEKTNMPVAWCPLLAHPTNGFVSSSNSYRDVVNFTCEPGYKLVGASSLTCLSDGTWNRTSPTCTAVQCPPPANPMNGLVSGSKSYGDVANFTCEPGYKLVGTSSLTCLSDGTWDGTLPTCTAVKCPKLPHPINGFVNGLNTYSEVINFKCDQGYRLVGKSSLTCLSDGTWNGRSPTCAVCKYPLGMESGAIPYDSITASSTWDVNHESYRGRLNKVIGAGAWAVRTNTIGEWLQVDLGEMKTVTGIIIQGRSWNADQWVTSYKLQYSVDGLSWITYASSNGSEEVFPGNTDSNTPVTNLLDSPTDARYVRFLPQSWHGHMSMRVEVLGCSVNARVTSSHNASNNASEYSELGFTSLEPDYEEFHGRARSAQREDIHACELSTARGSARVQTVAEMSIGTRANRRKLSARNLQNGGCQFSYRPVVGTCIRLSAGTKSYDDARKACIDDGETLPMPKTRELDVALRNLIKTTGQNQDFWIGMKDVEPFLLHKRRWQWEDGSALGNYQSDRDGAASTTSGVH